MYWVYVNNTYDRALVHIESCGQVDKTDATARVSSGYWIGPLESRELALVIARATGKLDVRYCEHCNAGT